MTIRHIKLKLQQSFKVLLSTCSLMSVLGFLSIYYGFDKWILGIVPSIVLFSAIGFGVISKAFVYLSSIEDEIDSINVDKDSFTDKFIGSTEVINVFYVSVLFVFGTVFIIATIMNYNILDFQRVNWLITIAMVFSSTVSIYYTVDSLTFSLFFISTIYGWTKSKKAKKVKEDTSEMEIADDYDVSRNVKSLIKRYSDRIAYLEKNINEENKNEYNAKIMCYQFVLNDLSDFIHGIDI